MSQYLAMTGWSQVSVIYACVYGLAVAGIWYWWTKRQRETPFLVMVITLIIWPISLPLVILGLRGMDRKEAERVRGVKERKEKDASERESLESSIDHGIQSAADSDEILPEAKSFYIGALNGFRAGFYEPLSPTRLKKSLLSLWKAREDPLDFVDQHFCKLLAPDALVMCAPKIRYAIARDETSQGEWLVALTRDFMKSIAQIDRKLQGRILEALGEIAHDPITAKGDTMKPLSHQFGGLWRYRLGDFRLIYQPVPLKRHVLLLTLAPRGSAYG